jgi:hypothetical protein
LEFFNYGIAAFCIGDPLLAILFYVGGKRYAGIPLSYDCTEVGVALIKRAR